jgi:hypothetical protein
LEKNSRKKKMAEFGNQVRFVILSIYKDGTLFFTAGQFHDYVENFSGSHQMGLEVTATDSIG